jgi:hypothetical protein
MPADVGRERRLAALFLLALAVLGILALRSLSSTSPARERTGIGDVATYQRMIADIRGGAPYYEAVGGALRRGHYATRELFNWRTPLLMSALAAVPDWLSRSLLTALCILLCGAALARSRRMPWEWASAVMQFGVLALAAGSNLIVMGETWAGVLIALSICAYRSKQPISAAALGLAGLFVRELAAPYCVVCTILSARRRHWRELAVWIGGACGYAGYYARHAAAVSAHHLPTDLAHASSWLEFGGLASVLSKAHWHAWLLLAPAPLTAIAFVVVVAGVFSRKSDPIVAATTATYLAFFFAAGKSFDEYWGLIAWPVWSFAMGPGLEAIRDRTAVLLGGTSSPARGQGASTMMGSRS